jgi:hypothetical protein
MVVKPAVSVRFLRVVNPDSMRHIPDDAERHGLCYHAERGNHQLARDSSESVSSRVNDTPHSSAS